MTTEVKLRVCEVCGRIETGIHEYPTYSRVLGRDTTEYQCDDIDACLNRKYGVIHKDNQWGCKNEGYEFC